MNNLEIASNFYDNSIRAETIIHIASQCNYDSFDPDVFDKFYDNWEDIWEAIGIPEPEDESREGVSELLLDERKLGFIVEMATPMPRKFYKSGFSCKSGFTCSWGWYTTKWFYAEKLEDVYKSAFEWREKYIEKCRRANEET